MKHRLFCNIALCVALYSVALLASAATFAQEVYGWDYQSIAAAITGGFLGGVFKTIYTLANDGRAVFLVLKESRKDLVTSALAGLALYVLMIMFESKWPGSITKEMRFGGVLIAGSMGKTFFLWGMRLARAKLDKQVDDFRGGAPSSEPPTSAVVPLADEPPASR